MPIMWNLTFEVFKLQNCCTPKSKQFSSYRNVTYPKTVYATEMLLTKTLTVFKQQKCCIPKSKQISSYRNVTYQNVSSFQATER